MFKEVARLFCKKPAGMSLLFAAVVALATLLGGAASAFAATTAYVTTTHWKNGSNEGYTINAVVTPGTDVLASITMSGAQLSSGVDVIPDADTNGTTYTASVNVPTRPKEGDPYYFNITYIDSTPGEYVSATVSKVLDNFPTPVAPLGAVVSAANPTFSWTAPSVTPQGGYVLSLTSLADGDSFQWSNTALDPTAVSDAYTGSQLTAGVSYDWSIAALDASGNSAEIHSSFMPGANFSGKVTDLSGSPVSGVNVYVSDVAGNPLVRYATTLADGTYYYGGLPTGSYTVAFGNSSSYVYYSNELTAPGDILSLTSGVLTTNVNSVMGWGEAAGWVYVASHPTGGVQIGVYDTSKRYLSSVPSATILADSGSYGSYDLRLIPPGSYYLRFSAQGFSDIWTPVVISAYSTTRADASLVDLATGIPTVDSFTIPATYSSAIVKGITVHATESNNNITGYLLTQSSAQPSATATGWLSTPPTQYAFSGIPVGQATVKTLYAWAKGPGGVSAAYAPQSVTITIPSKPGDANGDGIVSISEAQSAINMYLGVKAPASYVDLDNSGTVSISEVQKVINAYLGL